MASIQGSADKKVGVGRGIGWLFPWRKTFRRLELEKRWWHRLSVVVFFVALIPMYLLSWAIASDSYRPVNPYRQEITYWAATPQAQNATAGSHTTYDDIADKEASALKGGKTIEMPDGMTATYPGTTSDEAIKADWRHKLDAEQAKGWALGVVIAFFVTLCLAYLLQVAYRALLYVIYGNKLTAALSTFENPTPEVQASQLLNLTE